MTQDPNQRTVQELFDLTGQSAIVTGGTGYLGSAMASALAEAGARLIVTSRDERSAVAAAKSLPDPNAVGHLGFAFGPHGKRID